MQIKVRGLFVFLVAIVFVAVIAVGATLSTQVQNAQAPSAVQRINGPDGQSQTPPDQSNGGPDAESTQPQGGPVVGVAVKQDISPALRDIKPLPDKPVTAIREMGEPEGTEENSDKTIRPPVKDPVVQDFFGPSLQGLATSAPSPLQNFEGVSNLDGVYPPDTNGDVGPNNYVQWVNLHFQIFNKSGASVYGPAAGNTLWSGFGGPCQTRNDGDPVVLYDSMADRWVFMQFTAANPYGECVAVSTTGDPTGSYYRYFFQFSTSVFYDYPKLGIWPDGYYLSANRFGTISFQGPSAIVFDRAKMLNGQAATFQQFNLSSSYGTLLPADLDGATLPPSGSPEYFTCGSSTWTGPRPATRRSAGRPA
jgi:hypothetical protein